MEVKFLSFINVKNGQCVDIKHTIKLISRIITFYFLRDWELCRAATNLMEEQERVLFLLSETRQDFSL